MGKSYYFDEKIAPLTKEEEEIMKEYLKYSSKVDKIYERTDKVIRSYRKKKHQEQLKKEKQREKEHKEEIKRMKQKKIEDFPKEYQKFKQEFFKLVFDKKNTDKLREDFFNKCIHPIMFKKLGYYVEERGGDQGYILSDKSHQGCMLCGACINYHFETKVPSEFSDYIVEDIPSVIEQITKN